MLINAILIDVKEGAAEPSTERSVVRTVLGRGSRRAVLPVETIQLILLGVLYFMMLSPMLPN
jgi:hypothetical protein